MNEVGILMIVKKQICEDIEGEGVIQQRIGLRSQVLGGRVLPTTSRFFRGANVFVFKDDLERQ